MTAVATATLIQPDGRIIAGGTAVARRKQPNRFALVRYLDNGRLDSSLARLPAVRGPVGRLAALALEPDGRVVAVGVHAGNFVVARYLADGHLDPGFGGGSGFVETDFGANDSAAAVSIEADGRIVVAGDSVQFLPDGTDASRLVVARYGPDGALDPTYGSGGRATAAFTDDAFAFAARLADDGSVTVGGVHYVGIDQEHAGVALARFSPSGIPDPSFGPGGIQITPFPPASIGDGNSILRGMGFLEDGRVVAVGDTFSGPKARVLLERLLPNGALDPTFGLGGASVLGRTAGLSFTAGPDRTGAIYEIGIFFGPLRGTYGHAEGLSVSRYSSAGFVDGGFGRRGRSSIPFDSAEASTVQTDTLGRVLITGLVNKRGRNEFLLVRLRPGGRPDRSFGSRHR
jgi:uncharacterized delta-60 repeat protein